MKAVTMWQPWPSLIVAGLKTSETRSWHPPGYLVGERIGIHTAQRPMTFKDVDGWNGRLQRAVLNICGDLDDRDAWPLGAVVATARLADAGRVIESGLPDLINVRRFCTCQRPTGGTFTVEEDGLGDYSMGRWVWLLTDVQPLPEPIPARGYQGLWNWEIPDSTTEPSSDALRP